MYVTHVMPTPRPHNVLSAPLNSWLCASPKSMLKRFGATSEAVREVENAVEDLTSDLIRMHDGVLTAREEEFTSQLKSEINLHLVNRIKERLNGKKIKDVEFKVHTYTKKQEHGIGADFLGIIEIEVDKKKTIKSFLAQAKVGEYVSSGSGGFTARCYDTRLKNQIKNMLNITSDSFVFMYTSGGVFVVPALQAGITDSNSVSTDDYYYRSIGDFFGEFMKCFIGDHKIAHPDFSPQDLPMLAQKLDTEVSLFIQARAASA